MALWISIHFPQLRTAEPPFPGTLTGTSHSRIPDRVIAAMFSYTPRLAPLGSASLLLDVEASLRLFKGPRKLYQNIQVTLRQVCPWHQTVVSLAPTALGAWILARQSQQRRRRYLQPASLGRGLHAIPVCWLPAACPHLDWLHSLGATTLGELLSLPRAGLLQRTRPELGHQLDALAGKADIPLQWYPEPDVFHARIDFDAPLSTHAQILQGMHPLLQQLGHWLQLRQLAAVGFTVQLHHRSTEQGPTFTSIPVRLSVPAWQVTDFQPLLAEILHHHALPDDVMALALVQLQTRKQPAQSDTLFPDAHVVQRQEQQLLGLLGARLGAQHILQPQVHACHVPERASQWSAYQPGSPSVSASSGGSSGPLPQRRPFWMLDPALRLRTHQSQPVYNNQVLRLVDGPERMESGWWLYGHTLQRDYFIAQDQGGRHYWVYQERGSDHLAWFLQGLFA